MSVLIKGMEMPTRCFSCPMCDVENAEVNCAISHGSYIEYREVDPNVAIQERPSWCPLIKVPPHGRLIDADLFSKVLKGRASEEWNQHTVPFSWSYAYECLNDTVGLIPTVIPADKDGESR